MDLSTQLELPHPGAHPSSSYQPPRVVEVEDDADEEVEDDVVVADDNAARIIHFKDDNDTQMHTDTIVRAAEMAERQHVKQMRSMAVQMEWMQARWERELRMRDDAAFAKQFLLSEMSIKDRGYVACSCGMTTAQLLTVSSSNEHDLLRLETMTKELRLKHQVSFPSLALPSNSNGSGGKPMTPAKALKRATTAVRFIVRLRSAAREWKKQEEIRRVLVSRWDEYERNGLHGHTGGTKKPIAPTFASFAAGGGGTKRPATQTSAPAAALVDGGGGGVKKPAAPSFAVPAALVKGGGAGFKKPAAPSISVPSVYMKGMDLRERVEMSKRNRHGVDSELDEVESSAAPLGFDVESSSREREDRAVQDWSELDGTEAFSVDSL